MKRSRTCLNLVELDAPVAPKRTCSLPNIGGYKNAQQQQQHQHQQGIHTDSLRFFRQQAASMLAEGAAALLSRSSPPATGMEAERAFVVDSIVRSQGSLNEITIFEGKQFIGQESGEATAAPAAVPQSSAVQPGMSLFGGAVIGSLFDDSGDSSDYFFGAASSDEAEEDTTDKAAATIATAAAGGGGVSVASVQDNDSDYCGGGGGGGGGGSFARQVSDADSNISFSRQISDASSTNSSSSSSSGGGGYAFGPLAEVNVAAAAVIAPPGTAQPTPAAAESWRNGLFRDCSNSNSNGNGVGSAMPALCVSPLSSGRFRRPAAGAPRVRVRISSGRGTGGGGGARRQRSMTVPPPWPMTAGPHNRLQQQRRRQRRRRFRIGGDEEDGSLETADGSGLSEDAKMLLGMDRLRLFDAETASY